MTRFLARIKLSCFVCVGAGQFTVCQISFSNLQRRSSRAADPSIQEPESVVPLEHSKWDNVVTPATRKSCHRRGLNVPS